MLLRGPDGLQTHVGGDVLSVLDGPAPVEVLEGAGVALSAAHALLKVGGPCVLLLDEVLDILEMLALLLGEGVELDRELQQFVDQDVCSDGLPPGRVGDEGPEKVVEGADGRHGGDYTPISACLAAALRLASLRLRDWWFSAQVGHRAWSGIAGLERCRHRPRFLALYGLSCSRSRWCLLRSGL